MEQISYERPREKLRARGVEFLTLTELIQLIIGSGNARMSGARLARNIAKLLRHSDAGYDQMLELDGLGVAKVCQLLAAIELGKRLPTTANHPMRISARQVDDLVQALRGAGGHYVVVDWFDGAFRRSGRRRYEWSLREHSGLVAKRLFADALAGAARYVLIGIRTKGKNLSPDASELSFLGSVKGPAEILQIKVLDVYAANATKTAKWSDEL